MMDKQNHIILLKINSFYLMNVRNYYFNGIILQEKEKYP